MRLTYTVALPEKRGEKEPRGFRTISILGVPPGKENSQSAEISAGRIALSLWGKGCSISLTDVEVDASECRK